ncbi:unnamed protein product [Periconia digitata]|uniref:Uncharacterized protein n=1 Tax=Periconia digitata TaxID=1303443 RepID=A0A9W4UHQ3_9PLEO|nr:unnamed protein product [Periconia digitata]
MIFFKQRLQPQLHPYNMRRSLALFSAIALLGYTSAYDSPCYETECGGKCASGWTQMTTKLSDANMQNKCDIAKPRALCCPSAVAPDPKKCRWAYNDPRGKPRTIFQCFGYCGLGETLLTRDTYGAGTLQDGLGHALTCTSDSQAYCCSGVVSIDQATSQGNCAWYGSVPDCGDNRCPDNKIMIKTDQQGDASQTCNAQIRRAQCCDHPGNLPFYQAIGQKPPTSSSSTVVRTSSTKANPSASSQSSSRTSSKSSSSSSSQRVSQSTSKTTSSSQSSSKSSTLSTQSTQKSSSSSQTTRPSSTLKTSTRSSSSQQSSSSIIPSSKSSVSTKISSSQSSSHISSSSSSHFSSGHSSSSITTQKSSSTSHTSTSSHSSPRSEASASPSKTTSKPTAAPTSTNQAQDSVSKADDEVNKAKDDAKKFSDDPSQSNKDRVQKAVKDAQDATQKSKIDAKNSGFDDNLLKKLDDVLSKLTEAASALESSAATAATAATVAEAIAAAAAAAAAAKELSNQQQPTKKPSGSTETTKAPSSTAQSSRSTSSSASSSSSSACPFCVGCTADLDAAKRSVSNLDAPVPNNLLKRGTDKKIVPYCKINAQSLSYTTGNQNNKFRSYGFSYKINSCTWDFEFKTAAAGTAIGIKNVALETEHVFEAKLIPIFLDWVWAKYGTKNKDKCAQQEIMQDNILISNKKFRGSQTPISIFKDNSPFDELAINLSNDDSKLPDGSSELIGLQKSLNGLKENVLALDDLSDRPLWNKKLERITELAMLFEYLTRPEVAEIYKATSQRMHDTLVKVETEAAKDTKPRPAGLNWADAFRTWEREHLTEVGEKVADYVDRNKKAVIKDINGNTMLGVNRKKFVTDGVEPKFQAVRGVGTVGIAGRSVFTGLVRAWT